MVSYKIGISSKKESRIIDLEKITKIKNLEKLDELTSSFKNEEEFKSYLLSQKLISFEEMRKKLTIMYKYKGKVKKLPIIYQDMKKYLDVAYLKTKIMSLSQDVDFLEKLARHYSIGSEKFNPQGLNVSDIRTYVSQVRSNEGKHFYSKPLQLALDDMWKKAVFKSFDKKTGEIEENYRGTRDLGIFLYKYKKSFVKEEKQEIKTEEINKKESEPVWEQTTLFDLINNQSNSSVEESKKWILSSEGEPEFPPNSEEERNYKRYLKALEQESLQQSIEEHDHYRR